MGEWRSVGKTKKERNVKKFVKKETDTLATCGSAKRGVCVCNVF